MSTDRTLSGLPAADGLNPEDLVLVTQAGLSKKATVAQLQEGILTSVVFQQEATESEAVDGLTSDTVMTARRVRAVADDQAGMTLPVEGREYLGAFHNALIAAQASGGTFNVVMSGDSVMRAEQTEYVPPAFTPQTMMSTLARDAGIVGPIFYSLGVGGAPTQAWLDTYIARDLAYSPKLYLWHYGLNDAVQSVTPAAFAEILREGLSSIREDYSVDDLSIGILVPNTSNNPSGIPFLDWIAEALPLMRSAARDYQCAFIDLFTPWRDADNMAAIMDERPVTGAHVHPEKGLNLQLWSHVFDALFPVAARRSIAPVKVDPVKQRYVAGTEWLAADAAAANEWRGICWAKDFAQFVAVASTGTGNRVMVSSDGENWTTKTSAADNGWRGVCYAPELRRLVAVANGGTNRIMTSDDGGETWTARSADSAAWTNVCWSPDRRLFVVVGSAAVMSSPDGINWTVRTAANANNWFDVVWARKWGLFVAGAATTTGTANIMTSPDGLSWTARVTVDSVRINRLSYSDLLGRVVTVSNTTSSNVMTSDDGVTWTLRTGPSYAMLGLCRYDEIGLFVAPHNGAALVSTSPNGETWTTIAVPSAQTWQNACAAPELGLVCAVAITGTDGVMTTVSAHSFPYRS